MKGIEDTGFSGVVQEPRARNLESPTRRVSVNGLRVEFELKVSFDALRLGMQVKRPKMMCYVIEKGDPMWISPDFAKSEWRGSLTVGFPATCGSLC